MFSISDKPENLLKSFLAFYIIALLLSTVALAGCGSEDAKLKDVTLKDARIALDLTEEWEKVAGDNSQLDMGCIIVNKKVAQENEAVIDQFLIKQ